MCEWMCVFMYDNTLVDLDSSWNLVNYMLVHVVDGIGESIHQIWQRYSPQSLQYHPVSSSMILRPEPFGWICMSTWSFSAAVVSYQLSCQGGAKALQRWKVTVVRPIACVNLSFVWRHLFYITIIAIQSMKITSLEKLPERSCFMMTLVVSMFVCELASTRYCGTT